MRPRMRSARGTIQNLALAILLGVAGAGRGSSASVACSELDPLHLLPVDESCPGWTRNGEPATARTLEELQLIIDGGAPLFFEHGFVAGAFQDYVGLIAGDQTRLELSIYNQATPENAEALFVDEDSGSGDPVADWSGSGDARYRVAFGIVSFQFWEKCCFVSVFVSGGGAAAVPHARCVAEEVVRLLVEATPVVSRSWGDLRAAFR